MNPWKIKLGIANGAQYLGMTPWIFVNAQCLDDAVAKAKESLKLEPGQRFCGSTAQRAD